jgi:excisionase family DNA binding protein
MKTLYTAKETAAALRIHVETLYRWLAEGGGSYVQVERKKMFRAVAIKEFLDKQEQAIAMTAGILVD